MSLRWIAWAHLLIDKKKKKTCRRFEYRRMFVLNVNWKKKRNKINRSSHNNFMYPRLVTIPAGNAHLHIASKSQNASKRIEHARVSTINSIKLSRNLGFSCMSHRHNYIWNRVFVDFNLYKDDESNFMFWRFLKMAKKFFWLKKFTFFLCLKFIVVHYLFWIFRVKFEAHLYYWN